MRRPFLTYLSKSMTPSLGCSCLSRHRRSGFTHHRSTHSILSRMVVSMIVIAQTCLIIRTSCWRLLKYTSRSCRNCNYAQIVHFHPLHPLLQALTPSTPRRKSRQPRMFASRSVSRCPIHSPKLLGPQQRRARLPSLKLISTSTVIKAAAHLRRARAIAFTTP